MSPRSAWTATSARKARPGRRLPAKPMATLGHHGVFYLSNATARLQRRQRSPNVFALLQEGDHSRPRPRRLAAAFVAPPFSPRDRRRPRGRRRIAALTTVHRREPAGRGRPGPAAPCRSMDSSVARRLTRRTHRIGPDHGPASSSPGASLHRAWTSRTAPARRSVDPLRDSSPATGAQDAFPVASLAGVVNGRRGRRARRTG
jgi:hypothetical protein